MLQEKAADVAVARTVDRIHPVFALYRRDLRADLQDYLASGERRVQAWQARQRLVEVSFDDIPKAFRNINTLEELASLETDVEAFTAKGAKERDGTRR